ncbi:ATP-binding cassette domain-containing protein [Hyphococcus flavus]|uniref:ATP-binding cassette domain-containing protein n=1 Tax=Hyphococcus flavus TaxID=1866326 RepID=A0AAF0CDS2_9PROT|nr:ABC transporter transmembrane domain-containing protein [Hyphococcus flavus]WDI30161.1 ATP-binding cassette domain-containing protein [Hyphococcus flavus]
MKVLQRFLELTDWVQGQRRIFEAMPHADDVTTVAAFRTVLFRLGFSSSVEKASRENLRNEYLPCFLFHENGSVKLAERVEKNGDIVIFDPSAKTNTKINLNALDAYAIFPEQNNTGEKKETVTSSWSSEILRIFRPLVKQTFLISFFVNILALAPPLFVMMVYDKAVATKSFDVLIGLTVGISMIVGAEFLLRQVRVKQQSYLGARLDEQLNETVFRHLLHLSLSHTQGAPIGSQLTRLRQMTSLHEAFTGPLASAFFDLPFIVLFLTVIAFLGGHLVWAPVTLIVVYALMAAWALPKNSALIRKAGEGRAQLNNLVVEAVSSQQAINDLSAEHIWLRRQRKLSAEVSMANVKVRQLNFLMQTFSQSMVALAGVSVLAIGVSMVLAGTLSAGGLIAVMALSWRVLGPIRSIFLTGMTLGQTLQSVQQANRLVKMPLERDPNASATIPRTFKGNIAFNNVTFRYPTQREPALRGVSFNIQPGQVLCIYGQSGSGASTILRLLLGLDQQQAGAITVDGLDLRQLDKGEWRHSIGVGLQSLDLFHGTVAQNIRFAKPDATNEEIDGIVRKLGIDKYFGNALDRGVETVCSTRARATWPDPLVARINLARAFIKDVPIYLLDEPAATLDDGGERALLAMIEEKRKTSAIIMTSQRPSHMRIADLVAWMERGALRDMGPPEKIVPNVLAA